MAKAKAAATPKKSLTKSQVLADIAEHAGLAKADVAKVFDGLSRLVVEQLGAKGPRAVTIPGLLKFKAKPVKAQKGGQKKLNPLTGLEYVTKDKPASVRITARVLKGLKEEVK